MTEEQTMVEPELTQNNSENGEPAAKKKNIVRVHAVRSLPSERYPFEAHFPALKNAVSRSKFGEVAIDSEAIEDGLKKQSAVLNMNFFVDTGFLIKDKRKYLPSPEMIKFVKLLNIDEVKARAHLRTMIENAWFVETIRNHLLLTPQSTEDALIKELALAAEVSDPVMKERALRNLVDYTAWIGVIQRDNGVVTLAADAQSPAEAYYGASAPSQTPVMNTPTPSGSDHQRHAQVPPAQPPHVPSRAPTLTGVDATWLHREWPGYYTLSVKPDLKAVRILEAALIELKTAIQIEQETQ